MSDTQRVYVTTADGRPSFLVHRLARDSFISEIVAQRHGAQADGRPHEWAAYDCDEIQQSKEAE